MFCSRRSIIFYKMAYRLQALEKRLWMKLIHKGDHVQDRLGGFTSCTAAFGNGVRTGGKKNTTSLRQSIQQVLLRASTAYVEAALGNAIQVSADQHFDLGTCLIARTATSVSASSAS